MQSHQIMRFTHLDMRSASCWALFSTLCYVTLTRGPYWCQCVPGFLTCPCPGILSDWFCPFPLCLGSCWCALLHVDQILTGYKQGQWYTNTGIVSFIANQPSPPWAPQRSLTVAIDVFPSFFFIFHMTWPTWEIPSIPTCQSMSILMLLLWTRMLKMLKKNWLSHPEECELCPPHLAHPLRERWVI